MRARARGLSNDPKMLLFASSELAEIFSFIEKDLSVLCVAMQSRSNSICIISFLRHGYFWRLALGKFSISLTNRPGDFFLSRMYFILANKIEMEL